MTVQYDTHITQLREEFETYYSAFDPMTDVLLMQLKEELDAHPEENSYARRSRMHELLCRICPVKIFRHTPLFFEIASGRGRFTWGGLHSKVGSYLQQSTAHLWLDPYKKTLEQDYNEGFWHGKNNPVGFDHYCAGYDNLLKLGLNGIIAKAEEKLVSCTNDRQKEFYQSVIRSNRALIGLTQRFALEADRLAGLASDEEERKHYETVADTARYTLANPPKTFYEALNFILFYRECVGSIEGIGISTFSHLDRILYPYYCADLLAERITPADAKRLIDDLLTYIDVRFDTANGHHESSTTIQLGGQDFQGNVVYNELTDMILQSAIDVHSVNTKLNCRISKEHPDKYLKKIAEVQLSQLPCIMMQNDDVIVAARVNLGQAVEDARSYVGCGCHEVVLANTEVCTRADTWISLPRIFLETLHNRKDATTFEEMYAGFLADAQAYYNRIVTLKNEGESHWCEFAPLPLYSSSLTGPLEKGKDITEGGAKYNTTAISLLGTATLIDSLYSVKQLVFEEKRLEISQLLEILDRDYAEQEELRQYIIHRIPKHGTNAPELNDFSAKVLEDISYIAGQTNARGGEYLPAFYPHDMYRPMGLKTGATPDGRPAHTPLSRGVSPSEFVETDSPLNIIHSLKPIDFTRYADSFVTEITLPELEKNDKNCQVLVSIIRAFLEAEGSSLQFNLISQNLLLEAQKKPEEHKNLLVRVCGYSSAFVYLSKETQDEIIRRAIR